MNLSERWDSFKEDPGPYVYSLAIGAILGKFILATLIVIPAVVYVGYLIYKRFV